MRRSLFHQLYPVLLVAVLAAAVAISLAASRFLRDAIYAEKQEELHNSALVVANAVADDLIAAPGAVGGAVGRLGQGVPNRITVMTADGTVIGDSSADPEAMENHADRRELRDALTHGAGTDIRVSVTTGANSMYVAVPVDGVAGSPAGVVRIAASVARIDARADRVRFTMLVAAGIIAAMTVSASVALIARIHRPLRAISAGARRYANGDLRHRIAVSRGAQETRQIADTLNDMAAELSQTIARITAQRNELEEILSGMVEGVIVVDADRRIRSINPAAAAIFSIPRAADRERSEALDVLRNTDLETVIDRVLERGEPVEASVTLFGKQSVHLQVHGTALETGEERGVLLVLNDITRLRRLEQIRRDFVANVSHELKTPITAILASVETLRDGAMLEPGSADRFLAILHSNAERLHLIVEDLLSLSRLESLESEIPKERCDIVALVERAIEACGRSAAVRGTAVNVRHAGDRWVFVNRMLIEQAVVNLVDNAIKFSPDRSEVGVRTAIDSNGLSIAVIDRGHGIPRVDIPRVFERFYRVDRARSRAMGGTGLGLAIVKHIALVHHGEVTVESVEGRGSTFTIRIPVDQNRRN